MQRCGVPICETIVNEKGTRFVRLQDKLFCSRDCAHTWLASQGIRVIGTQKPKGKALVRVPIGGG